MRQRNGEQQPPSAVTFAAVTLPKLYPTGLAVFRYPEPVHQCFRSRGELAEGNLSSHLVNRVKATDLTESQQLESEGPKPSAYGETGAPHQF